MQDELNRIETAPIDALKTLKDEEDVLEGRIASMDGLKGDVAEAVYARVRADYAARLDALRAEAQPLKQQARTQYALLRALLARLDAEAESMKLDREEVELRHKLGEFDAEQFESRTAAIAKLVEEKKGVHEQATTLRTRFLAAVASEAELDAPAPPGTTQQMPAASSYSTSEVPVVTDAMIAARSGAPAVPAPPTFAGGATVVMPTVDPNLIGDAGSTMVMPAIKMPPAGGTGTVVMPSVKAPLPPSSDATVVFRPARLVPQNPEAGKTTFTLALKPMAVGSEPTNDIRLGGAGIDGRHAQIVPTPQGFVLTDLGTKHGTRVNAEKVTERVLVNEDVVQIGVARFVFRAG